MMMRFLKLWPVITTVVIIAGGLFVLRYQVNAMQIDASVNRQAFVKNNEDHAAIKERLVRLEAAMDLIYDIRKDQREILRRVR